MNTALPPFIRNRILFSVKEGFVGSKEDLNKMVKSIESASFHKEKAMHIVLSQLAIEFDIELSQDRKDWLAI